MSATRLTPDEEFHSFLTECLAGERCRRILAILRDREAALPETELAVLLATEQGRKPRSSVPDETIQSIEINLTHVQLPKLEAATLVTRAEVTGTVTTTNHPVLETSLFQRIVETTVDGWDNVLDSLSHRRRRIVLSVLKDRKAETSVSDLAQEILAREPEVKNDSEMLHSIVCSLSHSHLPKLAAAELITYDPEAKIARYVGHSRLAEDWLCVEFSEMHATSAASLPYQEWPAL